MEGRTDLMPDSEVNMGRERSDPRVVLGKLLRDRAAKLGYPPGSKPWRAYVLGTLAADRRRREKKAARLWKSSGSV
jgi:hypothetical protein